MIYMNKPATKRQQEMLDFIKQFIAKVGCAPSLREIGEGIGMKSRGGVHQYLSGLHKKGLIVWIPSAVRTLKLTEKQLSPIEKAIRDFQPSKAEQAGYEALLDWLESTTSFEREVEVDGNGEGK